MDLPVILHKTTVRRLEFLVPQRTQVRGLEKEEKKKKRNNRKARGDFRQATIPCDNTKRQLLLVRLQTWILEDWCLVPARLWPS